MTTALSDEHSDSPKCDDRRYPEPPSRLRLVQCVMKARDKIDGKVLLSSGGKAGLLLPLDGSREYAWAKKEQHSDAQVHPLDADTGEEEAGHEAYEEDLVEIFDVSSDDDTGVVIEGDDDDDVQEVGRSVEPEAGDESNEGGLAGKQAGHLPLT